MILSIGQRTLLSRTGADDRRMDALITLVSNALRTDPEVAQRSGVTPELLSDLGERGTRLLSLQLSFTQGRRAARNGLRLIGLRDAQLDHAFRELRAQLLTEARTPAAVAAQLHAAGS